MSTLRAHRPFSYLGDIGRFRPFHLSHKLCTMKIYTSAVFCKNIGCFSLTSAVFNNIGRFRPYSTYACTLYKYSSLTDRNCTVKPLSVSHWKIPCTKTTGYFPDIVTKISRADSPCYIKVNRCFPFQGMESRLWSSKFELINFWSSQ